MAGTANDVRAGGAWYELWGKDKLTPVLERAKKSAESLGGLMKSAGKKAGAGADAALGGIKGGLQGLAMSLGQEAFKGVVSLISGLEDLKKEYEKTARVLTQLDAMIERGMARRAELIEAEIDPKLKVLAIDKEIAKLQQEMTTSEALRTQLTEEKDRTGMFKKKGTTYERLQGFSMWWLGELESTIQNTQSQIDALNASQDKWFARLQELSEQRGRLLNPGKNPERIKEIAELTRELKKQADTFGQTAEQIQIYEQMLKGATFWQLALIVAMQNRKKRAENVGGAIAAIAGGVEGMGEELKKEIEEVTKALKEQADTWGMNAEQAALFKLKAKGANDAALDKAKGEVGRLNMLNVLGGAADAIANGVASVEKLALSSPGSFTAGNAAQRFGADTLPAKQLKAAEDTAKNTEATAVAVAKLALGLRFQ